MNQILEQDLACIYNNLTPKSAFRHAKILITGCAGFLGYSFLHFFCRYAHDLEIASITGIDSFILEKPLWLEQLKKNHPALLSIYDCDIVSKDMDDILVTTDADMILHMASIASPTFYRQYPLETIDANVWGLRRLLDSSRTHPVRKFLFFSSSEIYGDPAPEFIPTNEEYRGNVASMGPRACYDEAKRFGETLCYTFARQYGVPIVIVRPFNNYGPGMRLSDKRVPADFARAVLESRDIVMFSDGTPTRTFCYTSDAISGYLLALASDSQFDYFNIGMDSPEISVRELAEIYIRQGEHLFGYSGKALFQPPPEKDYLTHNPSRRCPDISKARKLLGYSPAIDVTDGVGRVLSFYMSEKEAM